MENQHFLDEEDLNIKNERPGFLTVLCIMSFVVSGFMLLYSVFNIMNYDEVSQREAVELMSQAVEGKSIIEDTFGGRENSMQIIGKEEIENHTVLTLISFLSIILSLIGVFMMFNLKKIGFHFYLSSKVIALIPLLIFTLSLPIVVTYAIVSLFAIAFVIMYSRNLKFMN